MHTILDLLALLRPLLFLAERAPRGHPFLAVFLPGLHVLLDDLLGRSLLLSLMSLFPLVGCVKALKVVLSFLDLFEQLLAHVLDFQVEGLLRQHFHAH